MKSKVIYNYINTNQGYYGLTIKETEKSIIIIEETNHQGQYDKELRYHKTPEIMEEIDYLINKGNICRFTWLYTDSYENGSYWQSWRKIF